MNEARAFATFGLLALGLVLGVGLHQLADRGPAESPYPALAKTIEPAVAHDVVAAIANDDPRALAKLLDSDQLTALETAMQPIVDVRSATFVGAVENEGRFLSAYVVKGKDTSGTDFVVGFVLRVSNDQVVGVN